MSSGSPGNKKILKLKLLEKKTKRLSEDLKELESYIRSLSLFLPTAIGYISIKGKIIDVNRAFEELTGYSNIELSGNPLSIFFFEKKEGEDVTRKTLKKGYINSLESLIVTKKEKRKIPVRISTSLRKDDKGKPIGYFISLVDITESKRQQEKLEEAVKEKTKELQAKVNELERFFKLTVGRELKMLELKRKIEQLEKSKNLKKEQS